MRYLDPKADLTFKRVFGEHPDLVMSLLNALLPLKEGEEITDIEYLPIELVPNNPLKKNSIVDVRCKDRKGRQFIVEMQMIWSPEFKHRVLFNASKAYVRQINAGEQYELLQPVYSLNLVNEVFEPDLAEYYHYYNMVHVQHTDKIIEGLHLIFVELPKFTSRTYGEKKMQVLWLRYLTEISEKTREIPQDLLENPQIKKAVTALEESAFTEAQLLGYEKFWDAVSVERTLYSGGVRRGRAEGRAKGLEEGRAEGRAEGLEEGRAEGKAEGIEEGIKKGELLKQQEIAIKMKKEGISAEVIAKLTGLEIVEINGL
ncbi:Rpn family recombination-promoting nuclease/putative transposase [Bacteroides sp. OttesenSCG-928-D19]|nr:Rpn family recombination-promoting nuclease/putative transposase [Bacteroides sp. OttesenSCG-928-D19]